MPRPNAMTPPVNTRSRPQRSPTAPPTRINDREEEEVKSRRPTAPLTIIVCISRCMISSTMLTTVPSMDATARAEDRGGEDPAGGSERLCGSPDTAVFAMAGSHGGGQNATGLIPRGIVAVQIFVRTSRPFSPRVAGSRERCIVVLSDCTSISRAKHDAALRAADRGGIRRRRNGSGPERHRGSRSVPSRCSRFAGRGSGTRSV